MTTGAIHGVVRDVGGLPVEGVVITTSPTTQGATTDSAGLFALEDINLGAYTVTASKAAYAPFTLANVGVAAGGVTNVSLAIAISDTAPGTVSGLVIDSRAPAGTPLAGVVVGVEGTTIVATTGVGGQFTLTGVRPGPLFLSATAPSASFLPTETREALFLPPNGALTGVQLVLSARPSDAATYVGMEATLGCQLCHSGAATDHRGSAHFRSLTRIARGPDGHASAGAFARVLNATLTTPRTVMIPLAGTITVPAASAVVTGAAGSAFSTGLDCGSTPPAALSACRVVVGDELGYTPAGLGWTRLGVVASVDSDSQVTLTAAATFAPGVTSLAAATRYGVKRLARTYTRMLPVDANDIVAPAWPGVRATNPNYDPNDPCIYGNAAAGTTCAAGGSTRYTDGQVPVYFCNLKDGVNYLDDELVQKFGGNAYSCTDGAFYDGITTPSVPLVHIEVIYGGQGDKDGAGAPHANMGVFKQRFQGRLADVKAADAWSYAQGKALDSLTLPIQFLESGDRVNGGFKMNGYHPTEQKFPGESWTQRTRTFSHGCAGCHNTGLHIGWESVTVTLPFGRDGAPNGSPMTFAAINDYSFRDENITCEQCHGPGSEHVASPGRGSSIINPKYLTAEAERQLCGKCHGYDDATNNQPRQDYGFEFPWDSTHASQIGGGDFIPGVYELSTFFDNWEERGVDDEAIWDPRATGGRLYGQAHRQQYTMLEQSAHTNNPYQKVTCGSCHERHSLYLGSTTVASATNDQFAFAEADFRDNVLCLSCHAGFGPFADVLKDDVANVHAATGGTVTKNGATYVAEGGEINASRAAVAAAVGRHMFDKASMFAAYDPTDDAMPVGRCTSCHMPKLAKSGGYITGYDASTPANRALVAGDQASHVFDVVWPWQSAALSRGGPTFQSGYYGQVISPTNVKYDLYGFMPNSCSACHANARSASLVCPDSTAIWPSYWPYSEHPSDSFWANCFVSSTAP